MRAFALLLVAIVFATSLSAARCMARCSAAPCHDGAGAPPCHKHTPAPRPHFQNCIERLLTAETGGPVALIAPPAATAPLAQTIAAPFRAAPFSPIDLPQRLPGTDRSTVLRL